MDYLPVTFETVGKCETNPEAHIASNSQVGSFTHSKQQTASTVL